MHDQHIELARAAAAHDGILTRAMLHRLGLIDRGIQRRVVAGLLIEVHPGVYRLAGQPETLRSRARAAFYWAGQDSLLTGGTVLALRGLDGFRSGPVEILVTNGKSQPGLRLRRRPDGVDFSTRPLDGMVTVTLERALLDACIYHDAALVGKAIDDALRRGLTTVERLQQEISRCGGKGRRGVATFRRLVSLRDPSDEKVRSQMETHMLRILKKIQSHELRPDFCAMARGNKYYLDFAFPQVRLGIECHSRRWHATERASADAARHRDLTLEGWTVLYFTWDDIIFHSGDVLRDIEAALSSSLPL